MISVLQSVVLVNFFRGVINLCVWTMENFVHLLVVVLLVWFSSVVSHDISS